MGTRKSMACLLAAVAAAACGDSTSEPTFDDPPGCYALALGEWDGLADEVLALPAVIELRPETGTDGLENDRRLLRPSPDTQNRSYRWSFWEPIEADSVRLVWSTGFTGIEMRLARRSDGYSGRAENFLDYPGNTARAQATLTRRTCA